MDAAGGRVRRKRRPGCRCTNGARDRRPRGGRKTDSCKDVRRRKGHPQGRRCRGQVVQASGRRRKRRGAGEICLDAGRGPRHRQRYWRSIPLLQRAAEQKSGPAMFAVGYAYQKGTLGQSVDIHEAAKWYETAAAAANPAAMVNLGLMYADGTLGPPNYREAYFWLFMAEAFNIPQAKNSIPIITPHLSQKEIAGIEQSAGIWWQQKGTATLARRPEREEPQLMRADTSTPAHPIDLPPQDALPEGVFRIGGDVLPPKPIDTPDPK